jgi:hypothetical protein
MSKIVIKRQSFYFLKEGIFKRLSNRKQMKEMKKTVNAYYSND